MWLEPQPPSFQEWLAAALRHRVSLAELEAGRRGVFARVSDSDPEMLRYLSDRGIAPGDRVEVTAREPFDGPLTVRFASGEHTLGGNLVRMMRVAVEA